MSEEIKKGPGRPKKQLNNVPTVVDGIIEQPANINNVVELIYKNPQLFKKVIKLFKSYKTGEIEIAFNHDNVCFIAQNHFKNSYIIVKINCRCMNQYYCKTPITVHIERENLEKALSNLNKKHTKITFAIAQMTQRSKLFIYIHDGSIGSDDIVEINIMSKSSNIINLPDETKYPISFVLPTDTFKEKINQIAASSKTLTIIKGSDAPLQLTGDPEHSITLTCSYSDPSKISLKSTLLPDVDFRVEVNMNYIRPFAGTILGNDVCITADMNERILFSTEIDKHELGYAAQIRVFAKIGKD